MSKTMNRRAMPSGATILPMLAVPAIAKARPSNTNAGLLDAINELKRLSAYIKEEGKAVDALEIKVRASLPPVPPELLLPIELLPLDEGQTLNLPTSTGKPNNQREGWSEEELQRMLDSGKYEFAARFDNGQVKDLLDCDMAITCKSVKMSPETKATLARLLDMRKAYDAAEQDALAEHGARQEAWEEKLDEEDALLTTIIEWPVQSIEGLALKAKALSESTTFNECVSDHLQPKACEIMFAEIQRLAAGT